VFGWYAKDAAAPAGGGGFVAQETVIVIDE
jgi:hypothetical protein